MKVVDFGLAKLITSPDLAEPSTSFAARSNGSYDVRGLPTASAGATQDGRIVGSPAYMSPEQAEGRPVDQRSDIWAFGCVLYEMLTGTQAFAGKSISETIAAVVHRDVDWHRIPADTPSSVRQLLGRCLEPDRDRRLADIGTARFELTEARQRRTDGAARSNQEAGDVASAGLVCRHAVGRRGRSSLSRWRGGIVPREGHRRS